MAWMPYTISTVEKKIKPTHITCTIKLVILLKRLSLTPSPAVR